MEIYTELVFLWGIAIAAILLLASYILILLWKNRNDGVYQSAARAGAVFASIVGAAGLTHWAVWGNEPLWPFAFVSIPIFYIAPAFFATVVMYLLRAQTTNGRRL